MTEPTSTVDIARKFAPQPYETPPLNKRELTHGSFAETALIATQLKHTIQGAVFRREQRKQAPLSPRQREALEMIATKTARILAGDPSALEHWEDIAGYAKLIVEAK
jgi:hypothetical protein